MFVDNRIYLFIRERPRKLVVDELKTFTLTSEAAFCARLTPISSWLNGACLVVRFTEPKAVKEIPLNWM